MEKIHSNYAKGFLLLDVCLVEQSNVDDNLAWLRARLGLKSHTQPAMRFATLFKTPRRDCIGENEKCFRRSKFSIEPFDEKTIFVVEHCL